MLGGNVLISLFDQRHLASRVVGSIGPKVPEKSIKVVSLVGVLLSVAVYSDWPFGIGVVTEERFRCTDVSRERFGHLHKLYDLNVKLPRCMVSHRVL